jgi:hypothetical protein
MPKGRMSQVVRQSGSFGQFRHKATLKERILEQLILCNGPGNLGDFDAVSKARAVKIRLADAENLRFPLQPAEG